MTWTYSVADLASSPKDQVRRMIGDVISSDQQIADEEINFAITQRSSVYGAAADCCRYIAAQYSRKADLVTQGAGGSLKTNYSQQSRAYAAMAATFESKSAMFGGAVPYAGGISVSDKQKNEQDTDRVAPQFNIGEFDNTLPVGSVGQETNPDMSSSEGQ